jgi:glutamate synthase (NADPH/NADH) large chain
VSNTHFPPSQGLYDPQFEKDGCGIGLVVEISGKKSHSAVVDSLTILKNLEHRGAESADGMSGDGCGIMTQLPDAFFRKVLHENFALPELGHYGVGMVFLPQGRNERSYIEIKIENISVAEGLNFHGWRTVPVKSSCLGSEARNTEPMIRQFFVSSDLGSEDFERKLYIVRKLIENAVTANSFAIPSFSSQKIVYKGLFLPKQLAEYYTDLSDTDYVSAIAMVHSRFSTNTFPSWKLAHPYRYLCHNGEINTLKGNLNWMRAREKSLASPIFGDDLNRVKPILRSNQSDSACLDNMLEFLVMGGRSLPHAMMMLIPEPWVGMPKEINSHRRDFYEYHATILEPWDGPAAVCFSDGKIVGATLDRNGLRPCRYQITTDDRLILSSEAGVLNLDPSLIRAKGRLEPGKMLLVDTVQGRLIPDDEIKDSICGQQPYRQWIAGNRVPLADLPEPKNWKQNFSKASLLERQRIFGYTDEELRVIVEPMAKLGEEPVSSMGSDVPLAILSDRPQLLFRYFKQLFAQVTNPPIDPIRESLVMSLVTYIGPKANLLAEESQSCRRIGIEQPILTDLELQKIRELDLPHFQSKTISLLFANAKGPAELAVAMETLCETACKTVRLGIKFLILSDRGVNEEFASIPSLLAVSAIHQRLIREGLRTEAGIIVETGEARDVHQFACLIGFGAGAVNPYLVLETVESMGLKTEKYIQAVGKGLLKVFSKMGISTLQSYCGGQIFQALGIGESLIEQYFTGTASSRIGGLDLETLGEETLRRHALAFAPESAGTPLDLGSDIHYRVNGEHHDWSPEAILTLQSATRTGNARTFQEFSSLINRESLLPTSLKSALEFLAGQSAIPLNEVEPAVEIVKRFTTGAMSLGAISEEAHQTLAIAMNRIGGKSNSGEGGEDAARFEITGDGNSTRSEIKQVASARFGVTAHYLSNASELQIKVAQGAKPGEGGQLPGHKVDAHIGRLRYATPGVQLISPPPHHDIYSIEDLKQLIFDLRSVNSAARISVKLVSEAGVGVVAAGVAKAQADKILISGDSGGTGASPLSSIRSAGVPWELGLSETHQTLVLNQLRTRVRLEADGQLRTGRDVAVAALLGAEEFGFATAPLIVEGCLMMRKCHLNTCPVGIATQDPELRAKFRGRPEHVIQYFFFVAEELRAIMAELGFRSVQEMVGRSDFLQMKKLNHWKGSKLDLTALLFRTVPFRGSSHSWMGPASTTGAEAVSAIAPRVHSLPEITLDKKILAATDSLTGKNAAKNLGSSMAMKFPIHNTDRAVGAYLSGAISKLMGVKGLPEDSIRVHFSGSAGQSFGAFICPGITFSLEGEVNDYLGKGLSGGKLAVFPPKTSSFDSMNSLLVGNTALYGATSGQAFIAGRAGERFAVRNSGATFVVEGLGDHGCEYMTNGLVVVLGSVGKNFGAGMSGGVVYLLDLEKEFEAKRNKNLAPPKELSPEDLELVLKTITEHARETGSLFAQGVLARWDHYQTHFKKIIPIEYERVLEQRRLQTLLNSEKQGAEQGV